MPAPVAVPFNPGAFAQCQAALTESGVAFEPIQPVRTREGCGFDEAVRITASPIPFNRPATLACPMALAFSRFTEEVLQPAARRHLGQPVVKVQQVSSYQCRRVYGTGRLSQHAYADAIDVTGFDLADGRRILVGRDWRGRGAATAFLKDVAEGACKVFRATLTPNYDRSHADHLHFDLGPDKLCGL
ncbi:MAG: extensin family protein [Proteobacteria bacterium]|nr:extensin family protein [Pseudomonadota bacterium]MBI3496864.1 extensin family protein [Pseudomonadota bacterium]